MFLPPLDSLEKQKQHFTSSGYLESLSIPKEIVNTVLTEHKSFFHQFRLWVYKNIRGRNKADNIHLESCFCALQVWESHIFILFYWEKWDANSWASEIKKKFKLKDFSGGFCFFFKLNF